MRVESSTATLKTFLVGRAADSATGLAAVLVSVFIERIGKGTFVAVRRLA